MKRRLLRKEEDSDPMSVVSNLFDVAMVFAVAYGCIGEPLQYDRDVQSGRLHYGKESWKREHGDYYERRSENQ